LAVARNGPTILGICANVREICKNMQGLDYDIEAISISWHKKPSASTSNHYTGLYENTILSYQPFIISQESEISAIFSIPNRTTNQDRNIKDMFTVYDKDISIETLTLEPRRVAQEHGFGVRAVGMISVSSANSGNTEISHTVSSSKSGNTEISRTSHVNITVYNIRGQRVRTLVNEDIEAGFHTVEWNGTDDHGRIVGSGVYFYRMTAGDYNSNRRMLLMK